MKYITIIILALALLTACGTQRIATEAALPLHQQVAKEEQL